jgi:hypothetical protein
MTNLPTLYLRDNNVVAETLLPTGTLAYQWTVQQDVNGRME